MIKSTLKSSDANHLPSNPPASVSPPPEVPPPPPPLLLRQPLLPQLPRLRKPGRPLPPRHLPHHTQPPITAPSHPPPPQALAAHPLEPQAQNLTYPAVEQPASSLVASSLLWSLVSVLSLCSKSVNHQWFSSNVHEATMGWHDLFLIHICMDRSWKDEKNCIGKIIVICWQLISDYDIA